ncbi:MAG: dihydropteroate synthase [Anaerolineae bacterium]|nr:dihydropteroate synthase [Anaerolineae bacterium]
MNSSLLTFPLDWSARTYVMGILNITPDSFSGDGLLNKGGLESVLAQACRFVADGAHILDVGGESTRPGSSLVGVEEELARVIPVVRALVKEGLNVPVSVDTYKAAVAEAALDAGAHWINDVWALRADPLMAEVAARWKAPLILMHNRSKPDKTELLERLGGAYLGAQYDNLIEDVIKELMQSVELARKAGVADDRIILDPGIGFGKSVKHNLELINRLDEIGALGFPVLLAPSRKSFIGMTLNLPPDERVEGTAAAICAGILRGANIVRVHDVKIMSRVAAMSDAIIGRAEAA